MTKNGIRKCAKNGIHKSTKIIWNEKNTKHGICKCTINGILKINVTCRIFVMKLMGNQWLCKLSPPRGRAYSLTWRQPRDHLTLTNISTTLFLGPRWGGRSLKRRWSFARRRQRRAERDLKHLSTVWQTSRPGWVNSTAQFMRNFWSEFLQRLQMKSLHTTEPHSGWGQSLMLGLLAFLPLQFFIIIWLCSMYEFSNYRDFSRRSRVTRVTMIAWRRSQKSGQSIWYQRNSRRTFSLPQNHHPRHLQVHVTVKQFRGWGFPTPEVDLLELVKCTCTCT